MNSSDYKGKILISAPDTSGNIFSRSVVLIIDHNENGAFGLILNKKNIGYTHYIKRKLGFDADVYSGGPVENDKNFVIAKGTPVTNFFIEINSDFYVTDDIQVISDKILEGKLNFYDVKVFSGYSGWQAQQLESEISKKMWIVVEIHNLDYTMKNDEGLWKNIMQNLGGEYLLWANAPSDISMN